MKGGEIKMMKLWFGLFVLSVVNLVINILGLNSYEKDGDIPDMAGLMINGLVILFSGVYLIKCL
jgi:ribose/xylose/arabinose/galactoside ABC-type transport system permease subunit